MSASSSMHLRSHDTVPLSERRSLRSPGVPLPDQTVVFLINVRDERIVGVTDQVKKLLGYEPGSLIGRLFADLHVPSAPGTREEFRVATETSGTDSIPLEFFDVHHSTVSLVAHFSLIQTVDGYVKMASICPPHSPTHTEEKKFAQQQLEKKTLESISHGPSRSNGIDEQFLAGLSHRLRTPLGVTLSSAGILSRYEKTLEPDQRQEYLTAIIDSVRHMTSFLEDLVWFGKLQLGSVPYQPTPIDLTALCHNIIEESRAAGSKPIPILFTHSNIPKSVSCDETLLRLCLSHLLANALNFSTTHDQIQFRLSCEGHSGVIAIIDHGIGVPPQDVEEIFVPFKRGSNVGETPGNGLGLSIARHCATLHHGRLLVESEPGKGTTFRLTLPFS